jgi:hypothetical protein
MKTEAGIRPMQGRHLTSPLRGLEHVTATWALFPPSGGLRCRRSIHATDGQEMLGCVSVASRLHVGCGNRVAGSCTGVQKTGKLAAKNSTSCGKEEKLSEGPRPDLGSILALEWMING